MNRDEWYAVFISKLILGGRMAVLILGLLVTVPLTIWSEMTGHQALLKGAKTLSTLIVIGMALMQWFPTGGSYGLLVLIGLVFSLIGDVALLPPDTENRFTLGLISFFLAHLAYIVAFWPQGGWSLWTGGMAMLILLLLMLFYRLLQANLGTMKIPVLAYMAIIGLMLHQALSMGFQEGWQMGGRGFYAALGAMAFFLSDALLALNRFWKPLTWERFGLVFYFGGQALIALSI
ncbi:MAG: lysoplasmalogenase [Spirochaetales bacterium]|nr:lysoplasmalogenase [Spirochaetales bacterium]